MAKLIGLLRFLVVAGILTSAVFTAKDKLSPLGHLPGDLSISLSNGELKLPLTTFALHAICLILAITLYSRRKLE